MSEYLGQGVSSDWRGWSLDPHTPAFGFYGLRCARTAQSLHSGSGSVLAVHATVRLLARDGLGKPIARLGVALRSVEKFDAVLPLLLLAPPWHTAFTGGVPRETAPRSHNREARWLGAALTVVRGRGGQCCESSRNARR